MPTAEQQLRDLKVEKQLCARRFGEAKRAGEDLAPLKAEMQRITAAIEEAEAALDATGPTPDQQPEPAPAPDFPPRFALYPPSIDEDAAARAVIAPVSPGDRADWDAFVEEHPRASLYHASVWRELIERDMGHRDASLIARDPGGRVVGLLPLIEMRSRLFGKFAVSLPYFNYGGPLALHGAVEERLVQAARDRALGRGLQHLEVRETRLRPGWPSRSNKVSMIRRLPATADALEIELGSKLRAQIRRAERENPQVRIGGAELLDDFYRVFARNMRDLGTPVYGKAFFEAVLAAWPQRGHVVAVTLGGKPAGAAILLGHRDMLEIPWASTVREANPLGVNMLMYRAVLGFAIEQGYSWFDFGRSTADAGTFRFKQQWGALPVQHHWHYGLPPGQALPQLNPDNPKLRLLIAVWRCLPVGLTRVVGPVVVRGIP